MVSNIDNSKLFEKFALTPQKQVEPASAQQQQQVIPAQVQKEMEGVQAKAHEPKKDELNIHHAGDHLVPNDAITKAKVQIEKTSKLPEYAIRGMKGDQDANFYEFLELGKIPYFVGGAVLTGCFRAGGMSPKVPQMAMGAVLFALGSMAAKNAIAIPLQIFRGIDLNAPYRDIVDCRAIDAEGTSPKKKEYHKVFESVDFTRWDLLENGGDKLKKNPRLINARYDRIAKKMGIKQNDINDSDSTLKTYIKKTLVMGKAFQYLMTVPFAVLGISIAGQDKTGNIFNNLFGEFGDLAKQEGIINKLNAMQKSLFGPLKGAVQDLWSGKGSVVFGKKIENLTGKEIFNEFKNIFKLSSPDKFTNAMGVLRATTSKYLGKAIILAPIVAPILATAWILNKTNAGKKEVLPATEFALDKKRLAEKLAQQEQTQQSTQEVKPQ